MEKKALSWTELRVGLVVIASLVILTFTILYIGSSGGSPWAATYHVKALMSDVNGLKPGAPVRLGGVEIGTVEDVDFASGGSGMIEVAMRLDRRVKSRITTQSTVTLGAVGLLGEKAVDISPSRTEASSPASPRTRSRGCSRMRRTPPPTSRRSSPGWTPEKARSARRCA